MTRDAACAKLLWLNEDSGMGFGVCRVAGMMLWNDQAPGRGEPDWPSIVAVKGPPEKYTDEELSKLAALAERRTADYDRLFRVRMGANLIIFDKPTWRDDGLWLRKRMTWEAGPMWSNTLDEALAVFERPGV